MVSLLGVFPVEIGSELKIEKKHTMQQMFSTVRSKIKTYKHKGWTKHFDLKNKGLEG